MWQAINNSTIYESVGKEEFCSFIEWTTEPTWGLVPNIFEHPKWSINYGMSCSSFIEIHESMKEELTPVTVSGVSLKLSDWTVFI